MLVPILSSRPKIYCLPVRPIVTTKISEAVPMTIPRAVSAKRSLLARKLSTASRTSSAVGMVRRALAIVRSNEARDERRDGVRSGGIDKTMVLES